MTHSTCNYYKRASSPYERSNYTNNDSDCCLVIDYKGHTTCGPPKDKCNGLFLDPTNCILYECCKGNCKIVLPSKCITIFLDVCTDKIYKIISNSKNTGMSECIYDQNIDNPHAKAYASYKFTGSFKNDTNELADDFILDNNYIITQIQVCGGFEGSINPLNKFNIRIYGNNNELPTDTPIKEYLNVYNIGKDRRFIFNLPLNDPFIALSKQKYFLSVQGIGDFDKNGEWFWCIIEDVPNILSPPAWRNPKNGLNTGCTEWADAADCMNFSTINTQFKLVGVKSSKCIDCGIICSNDCVEFLCTSTIDIKKPKIPEISNSITVTQTTSLSEPVQTISF